MGYRGPLPIIRAGLAIALVQAAMLAGRQTPSSPAGPDAAGKGATNSQTALPAPPDFRTRSHSHLRLTRGDHTFDLYLYAPNERAEVLKASFCGGRAEAKEFSGNFQLITATGGEVVSRLELNPDDVFVENRPHDGLRLFQDPQSRQYLIAIYQYGSCNSERVHFYSADPSGHLFSISFLDRAGRAWNEMLTGPNGIIPHTAEGAPIFCSYAKGIGYDLCDAYAFDGENFLEAAKWMTRDLADPARGQDDAGAAARALYDFLSLLAARDYGAAAYYCTAPSAPPNGSPPSQGERGRKEAFLKNYCTVAGGQCVMPVKVEAKPGAAQDGVLQFVVSFQNSDFQTLEIDSRSSFDFRVAKTPKGFKVLDLPPQIESAPPLN